jgi:AraC-like DNA-binding protein
VTRQRCKAERVARMRLVDRRTLSRRLRAEGTTFRQLANEAKFRVANQLLADTTMSVTQISEVLGFSELAAFTHAFRRWSGTTPSAWRRENKVLHPCHVLDHERVNRTLPAAACRKAVAAPDHEGAAQRDAATADRTDGREPAPVERQILDRDAVPPVDVEAGRLRKPPGMASRERRLRSRSPVEAGVVRAPSRSEAWGTARAVARPPQACFRIASVVVELTLRTRDEPSNP